MADLGCHDAVVGEYGLKQTNVLDGHAKDFVFAQPLVRRMGWHEAAQVNEGSVYVVLAPLFAIVCVRAAPT